MEYCAVSDVSVADLHELAQLIYQWRTPLASAGGLLGQQLKDLRPSRVASALLLKTLKKADSSSPGARRLRPSEW